MIPIEPCPPLVLSPFVLIGPNKKKEKSQNIPNAAFTRTPLPPETNIYMLNSLLQNPEKRIAQCKSSAKEVLCEWKLHNFSSTELHINE